MTTREKFLELLSAAFNINRECEPGDQRGWNATDAALRFASATYDQLDRARPGEADGILLVMRLFAEIEENPQPEYVEQQIAKGLEGTRHEWEGR